MSIMSQIKEDEFYDLLPDRVKNGRKRSEKLWVYSGFADNFTVVVIENVFGKFFGVSKRNPGDKDSPHTGLQIAAVRAYRSMLGYSASLAGYSRQRPTSKRQARTVAFRAIVSKAYNSLC